MPIPAPGDLVLLLNEDHELVKQRFEEAEQAGAETEAERFWSLTDLLVRHEVAEEMVVYPALRDLPGGDQIADARISEQSSAEQKLAQLEEFGPGTPEFRSGLQALHTSVLKHAESEASSVFPLLEEHLSSETRVELGERYSAAKLSAPNHPHPAAPDRPPGNKILGPVAALFDRLRDAASRV
jgi:hemerythrin superfamily protein